MTTLLTPELARELYVHMEWADANVWRVALGNAAAREDATLRDRMFHVHLTQRAFYRLWTQQTPERYRDLKFGSLIELLAWARPTYAGLTGYLARLEAPAFDAPTHVPWVKLFLAQLGPEPRTPTLGETILQLANHSTYHRGQINTRLRELGAEPPLVDYIGWIWMGRPKITWPDD